MANEPIDRVMIRCPNGGPDIWTGIEFDPSTIIDFVGKNAARCDHCDALHEWRPDEAFLVGVETGEWDRRYGLGQGHQVRAWRMSRDFVPEPVVANTSGAWVRCHDCDKLVYGATGGLSLPDGDLRDGLRAIVHCDRCVTRLVLAEKVCERPIESGAFYIIGGGRGQGHQSEEQR